MLTRGGGTGPRAQVRALIISYSDCNRYASGPKFIEQCLAQGEIRGKGRSSNYATAGGDEAAAKEGLRHLRASGDLDH
jgi:hypothetical protein